MSFGRWILFVLAPIIGVISALVIQAVISMPIQDQASAFAFIDSAAFGLQPFIAGLVAMLIAQASARHWRVAPLVYVGIAMALFYLGFGLGKMAGGDSRYAFQIPAAFVGMLVARLIVRPSEANVGPITD